MAVTHPSSIRNLIADQVTAQCDVGSTAGQIVWLGAASTQIAISTLASTAFGVASTGVAVANAIADTTILVGGTITTAQVRSSTEQNQVWSMSVTSTGGGGDFEFSNATVSSGQTLSVSSLSYTAPA